MNHVQLFNIHQIPTAITKNHNENYYFWQKSKINDATLLHIDAHADMGCFCPYMKTPNKKYYAKLSIANFICPAFHYGIISSAYWLNPYDSKKKLVDFGTTKEIKNRPFILTTTKHNFSFPQLKQLAIEWAYNSHTQSNIYDWPVISENKLRFNKHFILDIDLDAFCSEDEGNFDQFKKKINKTSKLLKKIKKPNLITITRSEGDKKTSGFVPEDMVDDVQKCLVDILKEIY